MHHSGRSVCTTFLRVFFFELSSDCVHACVAPREVVPRPMKGWVVRTRQLLQRLLVPMLRGLPHTLASLVILEYCFLILEVRVQAVWV